MRPDGSLDVLVTWRRVDRARGLVQVARQTGAFHYIISRHPENFGLRDEAATRSRCGAETGSKPAN